MEFYSCKLGGKNPVECRLWEVAANAVNPHHATHDGLTKMTTGFASPADDYIEGKLSLDALLIQNKEATFFVRAKGDSMSGAGISDGDLLVVDKSLTPTPGNIIIAVLDGELTVRLFIQRDGNVILKPENPSYKEIECKDGQELQVWGVVTSTIKRFV